MTIKHTVRAIVTPGMGEALPEFVSFLVCLWYTVHQYEIICEFSIFLSFNKQLNAKKIKYNDCTIKLDLFVMIELWKRISGKMKKKSTYIFEFQRLIDELPA